jgi:beta-1,4-mannosyltransferase
MRVLASPAFVNRWLNPYNWLLNSHLDEAGVVVHGATPWRILRGHADVWHLHWPDHVFNLRSAAQAAVGAHALLHLAGEARRRGVRLVWTVHNLRAHEGLYPELEAQFWHEFVPLLDGAVHLSHAGRAAAESRFPALSACAQWVIPHGDYRTEYVTRLDRDKARQRFGVAPASPLVLFSGRIRPYKNVPALLSAFADLPDVSARCLITGAPADATVQGEIEEAARRDPRVRLDLQHLKRRELAAAHRAADLVALPYREILNSGSALLALSLDRPVLVPRLGALAELAESVGEAWVRCYDGPLTSAVLGEAIEWARCAPRSAHAPLEAFAWPQIARAHRQAYTEVIGTQHLRRVAPPPSAMRLRDRWQAAARGRAARRQALPITTERATS